MIGCLRTGVHKQPIIALCFEFEPVLKFYNHRAWYYIFQLSNTIQYNTMCFIGIKQYNAFSHQTYIKPSNIFSEKQ